MTRKFRDIFCRGCLIEFLNEPNIAVRKLITPMSQSNYRESHAAFSPCRKYRYALWQRWAAGPQINFVLLYPSIADDAQADKTIRRCVGFAQTWGYGALVVGNPFALRATSRLALKSAGDPVGEDNDAWQLRLQVESQRTVAAWGSFGIYRERGVQVRALLVEPWTLGFTDHGEPRHPLYCPAHVLPVRWERS